MIKRKAIYTYVSMLTAVVGSTSVKGVKSKLYENYIDWGITL